MTTFNTSVHVGYLQRCQLPMPPAQACRLPAAWHVQVKSSCADAQPWTAQAYKGFSSWACSWAKALPGLAAGLLAPHDLHWKCICFLADACSPFQRQALAHCRGSLWMARERRCGWSLLETSPATVVQAQQPGSRRRTLYRCEGCSSRMTCHHSICRHSEHSQSQSADAPVLLQAAKVEQQYASWQPKEFADSEPQQQTAHPWSKEAQQQAQPQQQAQAQAQEQQQEAHQSQQQLGQPVQQRAGEQQQAQQPSAGGQEQGQQSNGHQEQGQEGGAGFKFDSKSGYWYDEASGYYYDANSGM